MDNNELKHVGVLGMRWGIRNRSAHDRALGARKKAELSKLDIQKLDQKVRLQKEKASLNPEDNTAKKRFKLEAKAVRAEQKARRLETISKYTVPKSKEQINTRDNKNPKDNRNSQPRNDRTQRYEKVSKDVANTPYRPDNTRRNEGIFKRAVSAAAVNAAGAVGTKVAEPVGDLLGARVVNYMVKQSRAKIAKTTWEKAKAMSGSSAFSGIPVGPVLWSSKEDGIELFGKYLEDIEFQHYGVKGMKWDKKKDPETILDNDFGASVEVTTDEADLKGFGVSFESRVKKNKRSFKTSFYKIDRNKYEKMFRDNLEQLKKGIKNIPNTVADTKNDLKQADRCEMITIHKPILDSNAIYHYGVKGMKWDKVKSDKDLKDFDAAYAKMTPAQKEEFNKKMQDGLGLSVTDARSLMMTQGKTSPMMNLKMKTMLKKMVKTNFNLTDADLKELSDLSKASKSKKLVPENPVKKKLNDLKGRYQLAMMPKAKEPGGVGYAKNQVENLGMGGTGGGTGYEKKHQNGDSGDPHSYELRNKEESNAAAQNYRAKPKTPVFLSGHTKSTRSSPYKIAVHPKKKKK